MQNFEEKKKGTRTKGTRYNVQLYLAAFFCQLQSHPKADLRNLIPAAAAS